MKTLTYQRRRGVLPFAFSALLLLPVVAQAQIHDNANLFSDQAEQQGMAAIQQMKTKFQHTMLIETYKELPADKQAALKNGKIDQVFVAWANERAKQEGISGVVLLISMEPKRMQMVVGDATATKHKLFTEADRDAMIPPIRDALTSGRYDDVATVGPASVLERMTANAGNRSAKATPGSPPAAGGASNDPRPAPAPNKGFGGFNLGSLLCVGVAIFGLIFIVRRIMAGRQQQGFGGPGGYGQGGPGYGQQGYGQPGYGGGGGGFGQGLMGGVLGGLGGAWLGNKVFGQDNAAPPTDPAAGGAEPPPADYSAPDSNFSGGGSSWGDSGGGGDFGGGDSGGGDFGGGSDF